ncbi:serine/threonine protein kinase [Mycobacterium sp. OAE908]|uniref:serine/threonine-protein kinase n=1 Tax=Mycobacterium sp. OAE908 TaxID=2817899 RepID=UPI001AEA09AA
MQLAPGDDFADYTIIDALGAGGMGEVYLARHPRLPRRDALKVLPAAISRDSTFRERFTREADLASGLWHPNVVTVYDRGEHNGQLWIAMEFVDGIDAGRRLEDSPAGMPVDEVTTIVTAVAAALDHAHKRGLLHRDVKPANIMLAEHDAAGEEDRRILLADFGIARPLGEVSGLTTTNMTVGTVAYAAPEQLMGEDIDGRADQYGLAATAYHLLTGEQLFPQSNPAVVISRHLNADPPSLAAKRPGLGALDPVLARALSKHPADRYEHCADFARALKAATSADAHAASAPTATAPKATAKPAPQPKTATASNRSTRHRWLAAAATAAIVALAITLVLWRPWQSPTAPDTTAPSTSSPVSASTVSSPFTPAPGAAPAQPAESPPTTTTPAISTAGFYGEWGQHATSVTLAPDGSAHYAVWSGVANGTSWSATWSAMTSSTAMIVLTTEMESHGDTATQWLNRYSGEAFTFTLRPDGYATITDPTGKPVTLCPRGTGFRDSQGLCGA